MHYVTKVSKGLYNYVRQREFFVLLCLYDEMGRVYLERSVQEDLVWSLPGTSVTRNEALHETVFRLAGSVHSQLFIGELEPIGFVENEFSFGHLVVRHHGVAFTARARNVSQLDFSNVKGRFIMPTEEERCNIKRFANRQIVDLCCAKLEGLDTFIQEDEIVVNEKMRFRYIFANNVVKRFLLTDRLKRKSELLQIIRRFIGDARSIIDVSCGDDRTLSKLISELPGVEFALANDISWGQLQLAKSLDSRILLTNHDATNLPFKENIFDVAICCNTLHHMPNRKHLAHLLVSIKNVAKRAIFVEIEDPQKTGGIARFLHRYWYVGFLKDLGGAYLSNLAFRAIISDAFGKEAVTFSEFRVPNQNKWVKNVKTS